VAAQALSALSRARQVRELADLVGEDALSATDRMYVAFETMLHTQVVSQTVAENRSLADTLDRVWAALAVLPTRELTMLTREQIQAHLPRHVGGPSAGAR